MKDEFFDVVGDKDNVTGRTTRKEAHSKGIIHRSVMFFIVDRRGRVLVNHRTADKEFYPEYWSIALGGHVQSGESYEQAVAREAKEEAGIDAKPMFLAYFRKRFDKKDRENTRVYAFKNGSMPILDHREIKHGMFLYQKELEQKMKEEKFLPETEKLYDILKNKSAFLI